MPPLTHEQWLTLCAYVKAECGMAAVVGRGIVGELNEAVAGQRDVKMEEARIALTTEAEGLQ